MKPDPYLSVVTINEPVNLVLEALSGKLKAPFYPPKDKTTFFPRLFKYETSAMNDASVTSYGVKETVAS